MSDLISRQAAIDATWKEPTYADPINVLTEVRDRIEALPSAQPKRGRWEERFVKEGSPFFWRRFYCSACGDWTTHGKSKFCPNCGAIMEEE